jgi:hypothetical protein
MIADKKRALVSILGPDSSNVGAVGSADEPDSLGLIAQELIEAVHAKDAEAVKDALRAAFMCCDSEPHVEGPHEPAE